MSLQGVTGSLGHGPSNPILVTMEMLPGEIQVSGARLTVILAESDCCIKSEGLKDLL